MTWNFHNYYANRTEGLIGQLMLSDTQRTSLIALRERVRDRTRDIFEEAKTLAKEANAGSLTTESVQVKLANTGLRHLTPSAQKEVAQLIAHMDDAARHAFLLLTPRFWTQGSFQYNTLNRPFVMPPQEMDIDDGTYLPMAMFENKPVIGHRFLHLLVDSSLQSLVAENADWEFASKRTCARIKIPEMNTHIDVPMYAVPEKQFLEKQAALTVLKESKFESYDALTDAWMNNRSAYELDSDCVNLALREGEQKWMKSDPKIVEDWFHESCQRIGRHLRKLCRFVKAWRDAQWDSGGPSSISLMAATVSILDRMPHDKGDFGATMKLIAEQLPTEFNNGVESPDPTDEKPLFPASWKHGEHELNILEKIQKLAPMLTEAETAATKEDALQIINQAFGDRVQDHDLIVQKKSAPAFQHEPKAADKAKSISRTMVSG